MTAFTPELVEARLVEAVKTLVRLPPDRKPVAARAAVWLDVPIDKSSTRVVRSQRLGPPAPEQITRMDEALTWLGLIENEAARRIVKARSLGTTWRTLQILDGRCHVTLLKVYRKALDEVAGELNLRTPQSA